MPLRIAGGRGASGARRTRSLCVPTLALVLAVLVAFSLAGCGRGDAILTAPGAGNTPMTLRYRDVAEQAGIRFRHVNGAFGRKWMPETMGAGCAFIDYDNDGWQDIFLVNGSYWPGHRGPGRPTMALYRNNRDGTFTDVTRRSHLDVPMYGMGAAVGDYNGDGYDDLYVTGFGGSRLFHNDGGRRFTDVTQAAGVGGSGWATSAAWLDYDRDGRLDLFVCHYVGWRPEIDIECKTDGVHKDYCRPTDYPAESCRLYRNLRATAGGMRFADVTRAAGIESAKSKALGVVACDYDQDGWPDIVVSNDTEPNLLYHNQGNGTFKEAAVELGIGVSEAGAAKAGMGIDAADLLNDGHEAILVTSFSGEQLALYRRDDYGLFLDVAARCGVGPPSQLFLGFGCFFFDADDDGWQEIFVANGHIQQDVSARNAGVGYAERPLLYRNLGNGRFDEVALQCGPELAKPVVARGACWGDFDNDGDPDILEATNNGPARLLRCTGRPVNGWLRIVLRGAGENRDAFGARVRIRAGDRTLTRYARSGSSYLSQSDRRLLFGLGDAAQADSIEIRWPDGAVETRGPARRNETLVITQGEAAPPAPRKQ